MYFVSQREQYFSFTKASLLMCRETCLIIFMLSTEQGVIGKRNVTQCSKIP